MSHVQYSMSVTERTVPSPERALNACIISFEITDTKGVRLHPVWIGVLKLYCLGLHDTFTKLMPA